jgi:hypothetical protein
VDCPTLKQLQSERKKLGDVAVLQIEANVVAVHCLCLLIAAESGTLEPGTYPCGHEPADSLRRILVDSQGKLAALVDIRLPSLFACQSLI